MDDSVATTQGNQADDGLHGSESRSEQEETAGTRLLRDLSVETASTAIHSFVEVSAGTLFRTYGGRRRPGRLDDGWDPAGESCLGSGVYNLSDSAALEWCVAYVSAEDQLHGRELWMTDGTAR